MITQTAKSFYIIDVRDDLAASLFKPEHHVRRVLIASGDFGSDIESTAEMNSVIERLNVPDTVDVKTELNPLFYPSEDGIDPLLEFLDDSIVLPRFDPLSDFVESRVTATKLDEEEDVQRQLLVGKVVLHQFDLPSLERLRELDETRHTFWN